MVAVLDKKRATTKLTVEEFYERYSGRDDVHAELVDGEIIEMGPPGEERGAVTTNVAMILGSYIKMNGLGRAYTGDAGFVLNAEGLVRAPNFAFTSNDRLGGRPLEKGFAPGPPDLAVEILSPSETAEGMLQKIDDYFRSGVRDVWYLYPTTRTVHQFSSPKSVTIHAADEILTGGELLPGFEVKVAELFE